MQKRNLMVVLGCISILSVGSLFAFASSDNQITDEYDSVADNKKDIPADDRVDIQEDNEEDNIQESLPEVIQDEDFSYLVEQQISAQDAHAYLYSAFEDGEETKIYANDFAGDYISEDMKLVVQVTNASSVAAYEALLADYREVVFITVVEHSLNELKEISEKVYTELKDSCNILMYGPDEINNRITVLVVEDEQIKTSDFQDSLTNILEKYGDLVYIGYVTGYMTDQE